MNIYKFIIVSFITISSSLHAAVNEKGNDVHIKRINPKGTVDTQMFGYTSTIETSGNGRYIFVSGVFSINEAGKIVGGNFKDQVDQSFINIKNILYHFGAKPQNVVKTTTLIVNHKEEYLSILHEKMEGLFGNTPPTSTIIPVPRLALDSMLFEIELVLYIPNKEKI